MTNLARQTDNTAFIPDSVTWEWSRPSGSEAQVGRLKGPKPVTYTMICDDLLWSSPDSRYDRQTRQYKQGSLVVGFGDGWWDCRVQAFNKPNACDHVQKPSQSLSTPLSSFFSFSPRITHTHSYCNPRCACAPRVKNGVSLSWHTLYLFAWSST